MAENYKRLYEQAKKMLVMYQDEIVPGFREKIEDMEKNMAEVVRCKDCRYWHEDALACEYLPRSENGTRPAWYGDDFCSYGERKTDETN